MKISINDSKAAEVESVYLDGKRLVTCIEASEEEGYVIVLIPPPDPVKDDPDFNSKDKLTIVQEDPFDATDWVQKRLEGDVEIVLRKREGLDDSGLDS
jgi:hypothetical protein